MASKTIKGITIEIGGDTTKLGKALENTEKKSRSLQVELRQIEQSLKFNPSNVELLTQKQTVLTQSIAETRDKLDTLKEAERQVIAQFERGEVAEEQVRALQREIIKTENQLESMGSELNSTTKLMDDLANGTAEAERNTQEYQESLDKANKELEEFKGKASDAFDVLGKGVLAIGAGATATAGYALKLSTDFDKAFNTLQTRTGATAEEMDGLNVAMENVYKNNFGESIEDVAESMAIVRTNTKASANEIQGLTETALLLRDVFGFEVNESTRSAKMLMDQFGISGEQAYNLIAQGAQAGLDKNGDLLDTVNEYSVHYKQLGYTSEEFFNSLINGASSGTFSVDKLGDAMKEFGIRAKDTATTTDEGFQLIGLDADEMRSKFVQGGESAREATQKTLDALFSMDDQVKQNQAGVDLFGTMWEDLGIEGVKALMDVTGEASLTSDALAKINEQKYDDLGSAIGGLKRTLETDIIDPLGDELKPVVEDVIGYVKDNAPAIKEVLSNIVSSIGKFVKLVVDNSDVILATIVGIGAGFLAWKATTIIASVIGAMTSFITIVKGGTLAWQGLNLAMKANIIGVIIGAITALVTAFIYLWNNCDEFRQFWIDLWETIKNTVGEVVEAIANFFIELWDGIVATWEGVVDWFSDLFTNVYNAIMSIVTPIVDFFKGVWNSIVAIFSPIVEWFGSLFSSIYNTLSGIISNIIAIVRGLWLIISEIFSIVAGWFYDNVIKPVADFFSGLFEGIANVASTCWEAISGIFSKVANWFYDMVIAPVVNVFTGLWDTLKNGASNAWEGIKSVFSSVANFFGDIFGTAWKKVKDVFSTGGKIFDGIKDGIVSAFKTIVNAIIKGINKVVAIPFDGINWALNKIKNIDILGLTPFDWISTISVPQIPELYRGGILKKGQVGLLEGNGSEAVVPLEKETGWINRIAQKMNELQDVNPGYSNVALINKMDEMIQTVKALKSTIVLDTGTLVGETINRIDDQLGYTYNLRERRI